jgi:hypothetical protein
MQVGLPAVVDLGHHEPGSAPSALQPPVGDLALQDDDLLVMGAFLDDEAVTAQEQARYVDMTGVARHSMVGREYDPPGFIGHRGCGGC